MPLQLGLIYDSGEEGIVLRAQCKKRGLPNPERVYAMKVLTNFFASQTATQVGELARHVSCTVIYCMTIWALATILYTLCSLVPRLLGGGGRRAWVRD